MSDSCGWDSDLPTFAASNPRVIRASLAQFVREVSDSQLQAWDESIPLLQSEGRQAMGSNPEAATFTAILEYQLPLELRRPDVILLENGSILIVEFKSKDGATRADIDQVSAYARDLRCYHRECHAPRQVHPLLVPIRYSGAPYVVDGTWIVGVAELDTFISRFAQQTATPVQPDAFLKWDAYAPLPTLVKAARELFESKTVRSVWRARAITDSAVDLIANIARQAAQTRTRRLVLLTGVPGSGKTLVGLRLAHAGFLDDLAVSRPGGGPISPAVFLSGNGPLVEVLQYELRRAGGNGKTFVRGVKQYVETYSKRPDAVPPEHLLIFDEAQRAWDAQHLAEKHKRPVGQSEPEHFITFAERVPEWCVVLGLVGTGQEIHKGEEAGVGQWREAIEKSARKESWIIHAPPHIANQFALSSVKVDSQHTLNLDTEIRYHLSPEIHSMIDGILTGGDPGQLKLCADRLFAACYQSHITRDLALAKSYALDRYREDPNARFGLLASARDKDLPRFGVLNSWQDTKVLKVGPWFSEGEEHPDSCRKLLRPVTEFQCQGLELDLAIVCWGTDLIRDRGAWSIARARGFKRGSSVRDPYRLRVNSYRVLLTRGRDGNVIFVPQIPELDETYDYLVSCGIRDLADSASPRMSEAA